MWADDALWLAEMLEGQQFIGQFCFDGDTMLTNQMTFLTRQPQ